MIFDKKTEKSRFSREKKDLFNGFLLVKSLGNFWPKNATYSAMGYRDFSKKAKNCSRTLMISNKKRRFARIKKKTL